MKASLIQLQRLSFRRVSVEVDSTLEPASMIGELERSLVFDGVRINTSISCSELEQDEPDKPMFALTLRVSIDNQASKEDGAHRPSLYLIDIEAGALFSGAARPDIADLVRVNGTSILWSAIREQVSTLTARMPPGLALLPTVHFQDLAAPGDTPPSEATEKKSTARKRPAKA